MSKANNKIIIQEYESPFGVLILGSFNQNLVLADWKYRKKRNSIDERIQSFFSATYEQGTSAVIEETINQLNQYFFTNRKVFELPILLVGSKFQQDVWRALEDISFGETETYLGLSQKLGNVNAIRAVASANGANAISIIIPCHRIIGSRGELIGYAGGLTVKKKLLHLEKGVKQQQLFT